MGQFIILQLDELRGVMIWHAVCDAKRQPRNCLNILADH